MRSTFVAVIVALVLAAVLLAAGCGGSTSADQAATTAPATTAPATTASPPAARHATGRDYLRLVAPVNAALDVFKKKTDSYTTTTSSAQIAKDAAPVVAALAAFDNAVLRANWPPAARADVRSMVRVDSAMRSDLEQLGETSDWSGLTRDAEASSAAANVVRADLGLPPPK